MNDYSAGRPWSSRRVVQRYVPPWQTLASAHARIWATHYRGRPMYQPWDTWDAWLAAYRALVLEVQAIAEVQQWAGRNGRWCHEAIGEES